LFLTSFPGHVVAEADGAILRASRRFLRARRWVVEDAFKQFKDTHEWRIANDIEVLYKTIDLDAYEQSRRMVRLGQPRSGWIGGRWAQPGAGFPRPLTGPRG